jgi:sortase A
MDADLRLRTSPAPRRRRRLVLVVIERALLLVGVSTLGYVAGTLGGATLYQEYELRQLDAVLRSGPPPARPAGASAAAPRRVIGRIDIPRLGVSTIIKEGEDARTLQLAVGHIPGTALPGAAGNIGLAGHRDTFFRRLQDIEAGDVIRLIAPEGAFTYAVERTSIVEPDDVWVLDPQPHPALTLVTCFPFTYVGSAPQRFIVHARLVTEPSLRTAARPRATRPPPVRNVVPARRTTRDDDAAPATMAFPRPSRPVAWLHTVARGH